jgi:hypothetical protein
MNKHLVQGNNMTQTLNFNNVFQTFEANKRIGGSKSYNLTK